MVIDQVNKAVWVNLGSKSEIAKNPRLEKVRENLSERLEMVLTIVEDRDKKNKGSLYTGYLSNLPPLNTINWHFLERVSAHYAGVIELKIIVKDLFLKS